MVDAVFETRYVATAEAYRVLPGLLFGKLRDRYKVKVEPLPLSQVPEQIRHQDPDLIYQPLVRIHLGKYTVGLSERSVLIGCVMPYEGWGGFRAMILEILPHLLEGSLVTGVERYSMKYVDLIESDDWATQVKVLNWDVRIGKHRLVAEPANLRVEFKRDDLVHIVTATTNAKAQFEIDGRSSSKVGAVIDVDSVANHPTSDLKQFLHELPGRIDKLHWENKTVFFECLRPETITALEAQYD